MTRSERFLTTRHLAAALVILLLGALLVPFAMNRAAAQTITNTAVVTTPKLNIRSGPGAGYPVVAVAEKWAKVTLLGRNAASSWAKVRLANNTEGWGSTAYMEPNVPWSSLPVVDQAGSPTEPTGFVNTGALNIRSGPATTFPVLMTASRYQALGLVGRNSNGTWLQVRLNGKIGWAGAGFITTTVTIASLPDTSGSVTPIATNTPTLTPVPTSGTPGPTATATAGPSPTPMPTATATVEPNTARIKTGRLNVRSGPGPGFSVLTTLQYWDMVKLIGRNANASWVKVRTANNVEGWISSLYIYAPNVDLYALPVMADVIPSGVIVTGTANFRSGPGINYTSIGTLNYGSLVTLVGRNASVSWIKVSYNGQTGWVGSDLVASDYTLSFLPVVNP